MDKFPSLRDKIAMTMTDDSFKKMCKFVEENGVFLTLILQPAFL